MGNKIKVLLMAKLWPLSMASYFIRALERRDDVDLKVCGQFSGSFIPWRGGMHVPDKYVHVPNIIIPLPMEWQVIDYGFVKSQMGDWIPDLVLNISSTCYWKDKPTDGMVAAVAVDPHVLDYTPVRSVSEKFFNMQKVYSHAGDIYLPYAYDPTVHYEDTTEDKIYDVAMVGLEYPHRMMLADELRKIGLRVHISVGEIFDDYRKTNSQAHILVNWSTLDDLNARAFEAPMMGIPIMNWCTDMDEFPMFKEYSGIFMGNKRNMDEVKNTVSMIKMSLDRLDAVKSSALILREKLNNETYDARIQQILDECGFGV